MTNDQTVTVTVNGRSLARLNRVDPALHRRGEPAPGPQRAVDPAHVAMRRVDEPREVAVLLAQVGAERPGAEDLRGVVEAREAPAAVEVEDLRARVRREALGVGHLEAAQPRPGL